MQRLVDYFTKGIVSHTWQTVGTEIETQFVDEKGQAISTQISQQMFHYLAENGWQIDYHYGDLITGLVDAEGNKLCYELGRHNIELATAATKPADVIDNARECLNQLYQAAYWFHAKPYFAPILPGDEDLLIVPDERDTTWLLLDGRKALAPLARTSAVQFTFSVAPEDAIRILNKLQRRVDSFIDDYPQEAIWRKYLNDSWAGYFYTRYGAAGPFKSMASYCEELTEHGVIQKRQRGGVEGAHLVPFSEATGLDIPLYLRSIWWYFRLKRYSNFLCIEVRPLARRTDQQLKNQLKKVADIVCS